MMSLRRKRVVWRTMSYAGVATAFFLAAPFIHRTKWIGSGQLHTLIEVVSTLMLLTVGAMALARYYAKKNITYMLLGSGFIATAILNGFHAVTTAWFMIGHTYSDLAHVMPWSG